MRKRRSQVSSTGPVGTIARASRQIRSRPSASGSRRQPPRVRGVDFDRASSRRASLSPRGAYLPPPRQTKTRASTLCAGCPAASRVAISTSAAPAGESRTVSASNRAIQWSSSWRRCACTVASAHKTAPSPAMARRARTRANAASRFEGSSIQLWPAACMVTRSRSPGTPSSGRNRRTPSRSAHTGMAARPAGPLLAL